MKDAMDEWSGSLRELWTSTQVGQWSVELWGRATDIWSSGGWAMAAIAVIALVMFTVGMSVQMRLRAKGFLSLPEEAWRRWITHRVERRGPIGEILDFVTGGNTVADTSLYFNQLRASETLPFERDLRVMKICVSAAPLVGLLGTVTGMLSTFGALSSGSGGEKTMSMVAAGISEALITTMTGLVIALPGLFFQYQLSRKFERYKAFLAQLESVCSQVVFRKMRKLRAERTQAAARQHVARLLRERLGRHVDVDAIPTPSPQPAPEPAAAALAAPGGLPAPPDDGAGF